MGSESDVVTELLSNDENGNTGTSSIAGSDGDSGRKETQHHTDCASDQSGNGSDGDDEARSDGSSDSSDSDSSQSRSDGSSENYDDGEQAKTDENGNKLSAYELMRLERIKRNQEYLAQLGLEKGKSGRDGGVGGKGGTLLSPYAEEMAKKKKKRLKKKADDEEVVARRTPSSRRAAKQKVNYSELRGGQKDSDGKTEKTEKKEKMPGISPPGVVPGGKRKERAPKNRMNVVIFREFRRIESVRRKAVRAAEKDLRAAEIEHRYFQRKADVYRRKKERIEERDRREKERIELRERRERERIEEAKLVAEAREILRKFDRMYGELFRARSFYDQSQMAKKKAATFATQQKEAALKATLLKAMESWPKAIEEAQRSLDHLLLERCPAKKEPPKPKTKRPAAKRKGNVGALEAMAGKGPKKRRAYAQQEPQTRHGPRDPNPTGSNHVSGGPCRQQPLPSSWRMRFGPSAGSRGHQQQWQAPSITHDPHGMTNCGQRQQQQQRRPPHPSQQMKLIQRNVVSRPTLPLPFSHRGLSVPPPSNNTAVPTLPPMPRFEDLGINPYPLTSSSVPMSRRQQPSRALGVRGIMPLPQSRLSLSTTPQSPPFPHSPPPHPISNRSLRASRLPPPPPPMPIAPSDHPMPNAHSNHNQPMGHMVRNSHSDQPMQNPVLIAHSDHPMPNAPPDQPMPNTPSDQPMPNAPSDQPMPNAPSDQPTAAAAVSLTTNTDKQGTAAAAAPAAPVAIAKAKAKQTPRAMNVGGAISVSFAKSIKRHWLHGDTPVVPFLPSHVVPQAGDVILYYPAGHRSFLNLHPDVHAKKARLKNRIPLWERARNESVRKKKPRDDAGQSSKGQDPLPPWCDQEWLGNMEGGTGGNYPILCRVEKTHAEFPVDPNPEPKPAAKEQNAEVEPAGPSEGTRSKKKKLNTDEKTARARRKRKSSSGSAEHEALPQSSGSRKIGKGKGDSGTNQAPEMRSRMNKKNNPPLGLVVNLRPLTPLLPPRPEDHDQANGSNLGLSIPPNFSVLTFPTAATPPFLIPFNWAYRSYHSLSIGDNVKLRFEDGLWHKGEIQSFISNPHEHVYGSTSIYDNVDRLCRILGVTWRSDEKKPHASDAAMLVHQLIRLMPEKKRGSSFIPPADFRVVLKTIFSLLEDKGLFGSITAKEKVGNTNGSNKSEGVLQAPALASLVDFVRSTFPLWDGVVVHRGDESSCNVSAWELTPLDAKSPALVGRSTRNSASKLSTKKDDSRVFLSSLFHRSLCCSHEEDGDLVFALDETLRSKLELTLRNLPESLPSIANIIPPFIHDVTDTVAPAYSCAVPLAMSFHRILRRLKLHPVKQQQPPPLAASPVAGKQAQEKDSSSPRSSSGTITTPHQRCYYRTIQSILSDLDLIFQNCLLYNDPMSPIVQQARDVVQSSRKRILQCEAQFLKEEKQNNLKAKAVHGKAVSGGEQTSKAALKKVIPVHQAKPKPKPKPKPNFPFTSFLCSEWAEEVIPDCSWRRNNDNVRSEEQMKSSSSSACQLEEKAQAFWLPQAGDNVLYSVQLHKQFVAAHRSSLTEQQCSIPLLDQLGRVKGHEQHDVTTKGGDADGEKSTLWLSGTIMWVKAVFPPLPDDSQEKNFDGTFDQLSPILSLGLKLHYKSANPSLHTVHWRPCHLTTSASRMPEKCEEKQPHGDSSTTETPDAQQVTKTKTIESNDDHQASGKEYQSLVLRDLEAKRIVCTDECKTCGLGSSFVRPAWIKMDKAKGTHLVLQPTAGPPASSITAPPNGLPSAFESRVDICLRKLKQRCLQSIEPDRIDSVSNIQQLKKDLPQAWLSSSQNYGDGTVPNAEVGEVLNKDIPQACSGTVPDADVGKVAKSQVTLLDRGVATQAIDSLSKIHYLPPWFSSTEKVDVPTILSTRHSLEKSDIARKHPKLHETLMPLPNLCLELIQQRLKNCFYRQNSSALGDLREAYVSSVSFLFARRQEGSAKDEMASPRQLALLLLRRDIVKDNKVDRRVFAPPPNVMGLPGTPKTNSNAMFQKSRASQGAPPSDHTSYLPRMTDTPILSQNDTDLLAEIASVRKLYAAALVCFTDVSMAEDIFGLTYEKEMEKLKPKPSPEQVATERRQADARKTIDKFLSALARDKCRNHKPLHSFEPNPTVRVSVVFGGSKPVLPKVASSEGQLQPVSEMLSKVPSIFHSDISSPGRTLEYTPHNMKAAFAESIERVQNRLSISTQDSQKGTPTRKQTPTMTPTRRRRRKHCGQCIECKKEDCRTCCYCLDMKRYGGPNKLRQRCQNRRKCILFKTNPPEALDEYVCSPVVGGPTKRLEPLEGRANDAQIMSTTSQARIDPIATLDLRDDVQGTNAATKENAATTKEVSKDDNQNNVSGANVDGAITDGSNIHVTKDLCATGVARADDAQIVPSNRIASEKTNAVDDKIVEADENPGTENSDQSGAEQIVAPIDGKPTADGQIVCSDKKASCDKMVDEKALPIVANNIRVGDERIAPNNANSTAKQIIGIHDEQSAKSDGQAITERIVPSDGSAAGEKISGGDPCVGDERIGPSSGKVGTDEKQSDSKACDKQIVSSDEDGNDDEQIDLSQPIQFFLPHEYESNRNLVWAFFGRKGRMDACARCKAHKRTFLFCRVRKGHSNEDLDLNEYLEDEGRMDILLRELLGPSLYTQVTGRRYRPVDAKPSASAHATEKEVVKSSGESCPDPVANPSTVSSPTAIVERTHAARGTAGIESTVTLQPKQPDSLAVASQGDSAASTKRETLCGDMSCDKTPLEVLKLADIALKKAQDALTAANAVMNSRPVLSEEFIRYNFPFDPRDGHYEYCVVCGLSGDILCCEKCPNVAHAQCVGLDTIPEGDWFCSKCSIQDESKENYESNHDSIVEHVPSDKPNSNEANCSTVAQVDDDQKPFADLIRELKSIRLKGKGTNNTPPKNAIKDAIRDVVTVESSTTENDLSSTNTNGEEGNPDEKVDLSGEDKESHSDDSKAQSTDEVSLSESSGGQSIEDEEDPIIDLTGGKQVDEEEWKPQAESMDKDKVARILRFTRASQTRTQAGGVLSHAVSKHNEDTFNVSSTNSSELSTNSSDDSDSSVSTIGISEGCSDEQSVPGHDRASNIVIGTKITKSFGTLGDFVGVVTRIPTTEVPYYQVHYEDGDEEDMSEDEIQKYAPATFSCAQKGVTTTGKTFGEGSSNKKGSQPVNKKRGRPPKQSGRPSNVRENSSVEQSQTGIIHTKKRGRPPLNRSENTPAKKRGRPPKMKQSPASEIKRRGRPPKNKEETVNI